MRTILKLTATLYDDLVQRLREPHDFAGERVAFLKCRPALSATSLLLLAGGVHHVEDEDYVDDPSAGATVGRSGLRKALQAAYTEAVSMVHVHLHEHRGRPRFSRRTSVRTPCSCRISGTSSPAFLMERSCSVLIRR